MRERTATIFGTLETGTSDYMIPGDTAWPVIGYTLAVPLYPRGFIHFSEPVVTSGGATPAAADLDFTGGLNIVSQTGLGVSEAEGDMAALNLTTLRAGVTMINPVASLKDIGTPPYWDAYYNVLSPGAPAPTYPPSTGYTANPNAYATFGPTPPAVLTRPDFELQRGGAGATTHRVSDVLISVPPTPLILTSWSALNPDSYFIWPIWAKDAGYLVGDILTFEPLTPAESASVTIGLARAFDGSQWLRDQDFMIQSRINPAAATGNPTMFYDSNVASRFLSTVPGIWLPPFLETDFSGLAGLPDSGALSNAAVSIGGDLWNNNLLASDPKVYDKAMFDFWFQLSGAPADLYAGRLDMVSGAATLPVDWYRRVRPFSLQIRDIITQRGSVTIMNNVIDPTKGERTRLNYVLAQSGPVTVTVFTLAGDIVKVLQRGRQDPGDYTVNWDGRNLGGAAVARGIYFIRVVGPGIDEIRKVMVVKQ